MAKNDMRIDVDFVDHIKTKRLIRKLGFEGFYSLVSLFSIAAKMYSKGYLTGCTEADIEEFAKWDGEPGLFIETIMDLSMLFLEKDGETYHIHDWQEHQGWVFRSKERSEQCREAAYELHKQKKALQKKRVNSKCKNDITERNAERNAERSAERSAERNAPSPSPSPIPIPIPIPTPIPTPEYDRDADSVEDCMSGERETRINGVDDPIVVKLPLNSGLTFSVHDSLVKELTPLYPAVDIREQLLQMAGWLIGNPSKRKTKKGIMRFITNWLSMQQDKAPKSTMSPTLSRGASSKPRHYTTETGSLKTNPHDYNHL